MNTVSTFPPEKDTSPRQENSVDPAESSAWARLGSFGFRRRRWVLAVWTVALVGVIGAVSFRPFANALGGGPEGFALAGAIFGVMITLPWLAVVATTWERPDYQRPNQTSLWESVAIASRQPTFRRLVGIYLTGRVAIDIASATLILYFTHVLGRIDDFEPAMSRPMMKCVQP